MRNAVLALIVVALAGSAAEAGPFRRRVVQTTATVCTSDSCATAKTVVRGGGAQAHAEAMAASGSLVHAASHPGYEGVGVGPTPKAAILSCCNNGGAVLEEGVARGRDGRWYACRRYSTR